MKRRVYLLLITVFILFANIPFTQAQNTPTVLLNNETLTFDVQPVILNGRLLVPMRGIFTALNVDITWDDTSRTVSAYQANNTISLTIGSKIAYKNGQAVDLDVPPAIVMNRTMVPLRFVAEALSCYVNYEPNANIVTIQSGSKTTNQTNSSQSGFDISGKWYVKDSVNYFVFQQEGTQVTGKYYNVIQNYNVQTNGVISGNTFTFFNSYLDAQSIYRHFDGRLSIDFANQVEKLGGYRTKCIFTISSNVNNLAGKGYSPYVEWNNNTITRVYSGEQAVESGKVSLSDIVLTR